MFINCPYCNALVATDPASDLPPERCPRCAAALRAAKAEDAPATSTPEDAAGSEATPAPAIVVGSDAAPVRDAAQTIDDDSAVAMPADDGAARLSSTDAHAVDADLVSAAMLGPAAVEVEIDAVNPMPDDARDTAPMSMSMSMPSPMAELQPMPALDAAGALPEGPQTQISPVPPADAAAQPQNIPAPTIAANRIEPRVARSAPSFVRATGAHASRPLRGWRLPAAIVALTLLLVLQLLLADRAQLAANARWRPWITSLCSALRCTVPPWREAGAFTLLDRDVRPHPTIPGALRVTASFRNEARWPQPWPRLALTLSDVDGREAGARSFSAAEYLGAVPTQSGLDSGQTATIAMDVIEPAPRIVAFTFEFH